MAKGGAAASSEMETPRFATTITSETTATDTGNARLYETSFNSNAASSSGAAAPLDFHQHDPIQEAMQFVDDCSAYRTAMEQCPDVVARESNHERYLAFCKGNVWEAASRIAAYWTIRLQVFGDDRAFLPLRDALDDADRKHLLLGIMVVTGFDKHGRVVTAGDGRRAPVPLPPIEVRLRAIFATFQVQNEKCQTTNLFETVNAMILDPSHMGKLSTKEFDLVQALLERALCIRHTDIHIFLYTSSSRRTVLNTLIPLLLAKIGTYLSSIPHVFHMGTIEQNLQSFLARTNSGIDHMSPLLPTAYGGAFTHESSWPAVLRDHGLLLSPPLLPAAAAAAAAATTTTPAPAPAPAPAPPPPPPPTPRTATTAPASPEANAMNVDDSAPAPSSASLILGSRTLPRCTATDARTLTSSSAAAASSSISSGSLNLCGMQQERPPVSKEAMSTTTSKSSLVIQEKHFLGNHRVTVVFHARTAFATAAGRHRLMLLLLRLCCYTPRRPRLYRNLHSWYAEVCPAVRTAVDSTTSSGSSKPPPPPLLLRSSSSNNDRDAAIRRLGVTRVSCSRRMRGKFKMVQHQQQLQQQQQQRQWSSSSSSSSFLRHQYVR